MLNSDIEVMREVGVCEVGAGREVKESEVFEVGMGVEGTKTKGSTTWFRHCSHGCWWRVEKVRPPSQQVAEEVPFLPRSYRYAFLFSPQKWVSVRL